MLSGLIRQVESDINDEEIGSEPATQQMEFEPYEPVEQALKIAIAAFSVLLLGLSISAFKKTGLKKIVYAAIAFGLFAVQMFFEYAEDTVKALDQPFNDVIFTGFTLGILVLFFMAIVRKR